MADPSALPCVLVVADRERIGELVAALSELPEVEVLVSSGGDDTIDLFEARRPAVVVLTASLHVGDPRSLIVTLRGMMARAEVAIVVLGDDVGPVRTALDALDLAPDRFVTRPLSPKALRFAVTGGIDAVRIVRGIAAVPRRSGPLRAVTTGLVPTQLEPEPPAIPAIPPLPAVPPVPPAPLSVRFAAAAVRSPVTLVPATTTHHLAVAPATGGSAAVPAVVHDAPSEATRAVLRARWEALADSIVDDEDAAAERPRAPARAEVPAHAEVPDRAEASARGGVPVGDSEHARAEAPARGSRPTRGEAAVRGEAQTRGELPILRGSAPGRADSEDDAEPLPPPIVIKPRRHAMDLLFDDAAVAGWKPEVERLPVREPTLVIRETPPAPAAPVPAPASPPAGSRTRTGDGQLVVAARTSSDELWSEPTPIAELNDREPRAELDDPAPADDGRERAPRRGRRSELDDDSDAGGGSELYDDELGPVVDVRAVTHDHRERGSELDGVPPGYDELGSDVDGAVPDDLGAPISELDDEPIRERPSAPVIERSDAPDARRSGPVLKLSEARDFARELRAKMSMMAQRLFHGSDAPVPSPADHAPRHDHLTEIDLAALGDEPPLAIGGAELEGATAQREIRELVTSPGSWDSQVRERGLADSGALLRGVSDAAMLLAKMFAQGATGRVWFRRDDVETTVYFDRGRPVFAASNEPRDRMGELLLREGKITASQYERCQTMVAESGRRTGEILVDFGYLKRRELLPAVRRHVEDIVYSLFSWDRGSYRVTLDPAPSAERIRLSRHPASLILEGIRRKLDRASLEHLIGPTSTVIEVPDRDRLGGIVNLGDLAAEERAALAAFDGQADLAQVARTAGVDLVDILPLAWGLCVLGLATARRTDAEVSDESTALVGETDLAIDRERVRARWQLVTDADYFALLGVRRDATAFEIRRAYQSARRDFAADCFPGDLRRELARELDDIAQVLDEAFRVLRDDRLRQTYLANLVDD